MNDTLDNKNNWDMICNQCGKCCLEKLEDARGRIIYTEDACKYLDLETRLCRIFDRRFEINPECVKLTPELVEKLRWLPKDCAYRPEEAKFTRKTARTRKKRNS
jgi:uncharacterized protein